MLQVPIFGALIAGNLVLARLTSPRRSVRSLIADYGRPRLCLACPAFGGNTKSRPMLICG